MNAGQKITAALYALDDAQKNAVELKARKGDAHIVLSTLKGKAGLTMVEASAKLLAEFVRDLPC